MPTLPKRTGGEVWTKTLDCKEATCRVGSQISFIWAHKALIRWGFGGFSFQQMHKSPLSPWTRQSKWHLGAEPVEVSFYIMPLIHTVWLTFVQTRKRMQFYCLFILFCFLPIYGRTQASMYTIDPLLRIWNNKWLCSLRWKASSNFE